MSISAIAAAAGGGFTADNVTVVADFYSLFEGATWTDGGKWTWVAGNAARIEDTIFLVFTTTLDANVPGGRGLRVFTSGQDGNEVWQVLNNASGPATPSVGEWTTWRWFAKLIDSDGDGDYHSTGFGAGNALNSSGSGGAIYTYVGTGDPVQSRLRVAGSTQTQPYSTAGNVIPRNEWVRWEVNWGRDATSLWTLRVRAYNEAGTLLFFEENQLENFGSGPDDLTADNGAISYATASDRTIMEIGCPGLGTVTTEPERYAAFAAITDSAPHVDMPYGYFSHEI